MEIIAHNVILTEDIRNACNNNTNVILEIKFIFYNTIDYAYGDWSGKFNGVKSVNLVQWKNIYHIYKTSENVNRGNEFKQVTGVYKYSIVHKENPIKIFMNF